MPAVCTVGILSQRTEEASAEFGVWTRVRNRKVFIDKPKSEEVEETKTEDKVEENK